jgi:hypothetical protein
MGVFLPADVLAKRAELFREGEQDFVLVVELVLEERDELVACSLRAEGEGDGGEPADRGQAEGDVVRFELVYGAEGDKGRERM